MTDIIDDANEVAAAFLTKSLAAHKAAVKHTHPYKEGEGEFECHECDIIVPMARRQLTGSPYCTDCQEDHNDRNKKL